MRDPIDELAEYRIARVAVVAGDIACDLDDPEWRVVVSAGHPLKDDFSVLDPCPVTHEVVHMPLCVRREVALAWAGFVMVGPERREETGNGATERVGPARCGVSFRRDRNSDRARRFHDLAVGAPKFEACVRSLQKVNELP